MKIEIYKNYLEKCKVISKISLFLNFSVLGASYLFNIVNIQVVVDFYITKKIFLE